MIRIAVALALMMASAMAYAYVKSPFDRSVEVVAGSGMEDVALDGLLDRIEADNAGKPFVVTRTKWLNALFDHAQLAVVSNDVYVDWFPADDKVARRRVQRLGKFAASRPELKGKKAWRDGVNGAYIACLDPSHVCPDWESVLKFGLKGLAERARQRRATATNDDERLFIDCVVEVYEGACRLARRWADVCDDVGARECAAVLRELAEHEPRTLREALQLMLLYDRCEEAEGEYVRTQGLFDRLYIGFYRNDLVAGRETRESAKALVREMYLKFYRQWHPNGKNIAFGGYDREGKAVWNELTEIGFELHYELNHHNPKLTYRYGARTPDEQLMKVARCLADGRTSVVFFNDDVGREMFMRRGKTAEDATDAVLVGCYEPAIQGREVIASMASWINMAKPLEAVLNGGCDFDGKWKGPKCTLPADYAAFEREYLRQLDALATEALETTRFWESNWYELNPSPLMSGAFRDAVANARDAYCGGMKYNQSGVMCAGMATVADSLAAVRYLVDEAKLVTMVELAEIVRNNWKGHEELRLRARNAAPKWGNNDDRVDVLGKLVYDRLSAKVNATKNGHGGTYQAGFWSIDNDIRLGGCTGATPDGRRYGETLSRNNSATAGCGKGGPTALLLSNAKLDQANSPDGYILDVILPATAVRDERSAARIAAFLRTFGAKGGQCIHFNVFNSWTLREAQSHPERYPDLQVRVCGWNVRWNDLSKREQDHFIATAEAQE